MLLLRMLKPKLSLLVANLLEQSALINSKTLLIVLKQVVLRLQLLLLQEKLMILRSMVKLIRKVENLNVNTMVVMMKLRKLNQMKLLPWKVLTQEKNTLMMENLKVLLKLQHSISETFL